VIGALILGVIAGFLARALLPGKQSMGFLLTIVLGLAGSFVGFLIFTEVLGIGDNDAFDLGGLPGAVIGAMVLLFAYERFVSSRDEQASGKPAPGRSAAPSEESPERRRDREREERRQRRERRER
jgi:uncharacterized membrane protein YeaQ/YmgE (transglycosylase-associated protein family)